VSVFDSVLSSSDVMSQPDGGRGGDRSYHSNTAPQVASSTIVFILPAEGKIHLTSSEKNLTAPSVV
jgi:hypothetical protein